MQEHSHSYHAAKIQNIIDMVVVLQPFLAEFVRFFTKNTRYEVRGTIFEVRGARYEIRDTRYVLNPCFLRGVRRSVLFSHLAPRISLKNLPFRAPFPLEGLGEAVTISFRR